METFSYDRIYSSRSVRYTVHIAFWIGILWLMCLINSIVFREGILNEITVYYSLCSLPLVMSGHYLLVNFLINKTRIEKFIAGYLLIMVWYVGAIVIKSNLLQWFSAAYPENVYLSVLMTRYQILNITDLFSFAHVHGMFSFIIVYNIISMGMKIFMDFYRAQLEELRMIGERKYMESMSLRTKLSPRTFLGILEEIRQDLPVEHQAFKAIIGLSDLMQFSINDISRNAIQLKEEINFLSNYAALQRMFHRDDRVAIEFNWAKVHDKSILIKPLLLVNFVENAFKHGVKTSKEKIFVYMNLEVENEILTFHVINNKSPHGDSTVFQQAKDGIGLTNVKRRLQLEYPDRHTLTINDTIREFEIELVLKL